MDLSVLESALVEYRETLEEERKSLAGRARLVLGELSHKYGLEEAYLFGSVVRPYRFQRDSDIDVAVRGLAPRRFFEFMAELSERLGRDVDIVELEKAGMADKIFREGIKVG